MADKKRLIAENDVYELFDKNGIAKLHVADIDLLPRVDAVPVVHGRWWYNNPTDTLNEHLMCTACKCLFWKNIEEMVSYPYCPNCGAKMRGNEE